MRDFVKKLTGHSLVRFGIIGVYNTAIDIGLFMIGYALLNWHPGVTNVIAFFIANVQSYILNKYWAFRHSHRHPLSLTEYGRFLSASLFTVIASTAIITYGTSYLDPVVLKLITVFVLPFVSFTLYRLIFRHPSPTEQH